MLPPPCKPRPIRLCAPHPCGLRFNLEPWNFSTNYLKPFLPSCVCTSEQYKNDHCPTPCRAPPTRRRLPFSHHSTTPLLPPPPPCAILSRFLLFAPYITGSTFCTTATYKSRTEKIPEFQFWRRNPPQPPITPRNLPQPLQTSQRSMFSVRCSTFSSPSPLWACWAAGSGVYLALPGPMECGLTNPARAGRQQRQFAPHPPWSPWHFQIFVFLL